MPRSGVTHHHFVPPLPHTLPRNHSRAQTGKLPLGSPPVPSSHIHQPAGPMFKVLGASSPCFLVSDINNTSCKSGLTSVFCPHLSCLSIKLLLQGSTWLSQEPRALPSSAAEARATLHRKEHHPCLSQELGRKAGQLPMTQALPRQGHPGVALA